MVRLNPRPQRSVARLRKYKNNVFDQIDIFVKYRAKATAKLIAPSLYSLSELVHGTTNAIASVFSPRGACIIAYKVLLANPFSWYEICSPESTSHDAITSLRSATPLFHLSNLPLYTREQYSIRSP